MCVIMHILYYSVEVKGDDSNDSVFEETGPVQEKLIEEKQIITG